VDAVELMREVLSEAWHEIAADPVRYLIELVQFCLLVFGVKAVAFGIGKRKGIVTNLLAERRERVRSALERAEAAPSELAEARHGAEAALATARASRRRVLADAKKRAVEEEAALLSSAEQEAAALLRQADEALAKERSEIARKAAKTRWAEKD
jgi:F0F1-type ATP synthase membrane subunit b/b'